MKTSIYSLIALCVLIAVASASEEVFNTIPQGKLGYSLGKYLEIEGQRSDGGKGGRHTLIVHKVNGVILEKKIGIRIENVTPYLPEGETIILKGYENGKMIGTPPGEREAAKERGGKPRGEEVYPRQFAWSFSRYFVATSVISPKTIQIAK